MASQQPMNGSFLSWEIEQILPQLPNYIYLIDKDCSFLTCNNNFLSLLTAAKTGLKKDNFYKQLLSEGKVSSTRVERLKKDDIEALLEEKVRLDVEEPPIVIEDSIFYMRSSRIPLLNKKGELAGLMVVLVDTTENVRLKEQIDKIRLQLQQENSKPVENSRAVLKEEEIIPRVLLIEDNTIAQKAVQSILMQLDCKVEVAATSEEVLTLFAPGKYNIIFMDIGLEGTSGYVLAKQIRKLEKETVYHTPIIALTGYEADIVKYDCMDYTMEGAITKPLTSEQAKQIIQHFIYQIDIPISGLKNI